MASQMQIAQGRTRVDIRREGHLRRAPYSAQEECSTMRGKPRKRSRADFSAFVRGCIIDRILAYRFISKFQSSLQNKANDQSKKAVRTTQRNHRKARSRTRVRAPSISLCESSGATNCSGDPLGPFRRLTPLLHCRVLQIIEHLSRGLLGSEPDVAENKAQEAWLHRVFQICGVYIFSRAICRRKMLARPVGFHSQDARDLGLLLR